MKKKAGGAWNTTIRRGSNHERNREKRLKIEKAMPMSVSKLNRPH
jgi:hypothetical protein